MPCMGPVFNEEKFEEAYKEIMELLKVKYRIQDSRPLYKRDQLLRQEKNTVLHAALQAVMQQQCFEDF